MANAREAVWTATDFRNRKPRHISQQNHIRATDRRPPSIRNDDDISPPVAGTSLEGNCVANAREAVWTATDFRKTANLVIFRNKTIRATDRRPPSIRNDDDISPPVAGTSLEGNCVANAREAVLTATDFRNSKPRHISTKPYSCNRSTASFDPKR